MSNSEDSFASRWSRRKQQVREGVDSASAEPAVPANTIVSDGSVGRMQTCTEANRQAEAAAREAADRGEVPPVLSDNDMPPIESLNENSDFTGFMSPGVSEKLRRLALRKLFAGAGFNIRDGLDDYDQDFTNFAPLGDIVTCDMKHRAEMEAQKKAEAERIAAEEQERLVAEGDVAPVGSEESLEPVESVDEKAVTLEGNDEQAPDAIEGEEGSGEITRVTSNEETGEPDDSSEKV